MGLMVCNNFECCQEELGGQDFLVTSCFHAFCGQCSGLVCENSRCLACQQALTEGDISTVRDGSNPLLLFGLDPAQISSIQCRALQFYDWQMNLRLQLLAEEKAELTQKKNKLKQAMCEMQAKQVSAVNIMQTRNHALEKELEAEKIKSQTLKKKLEDESRLKRRLEDEVSRRWQRNTSISFLSNSSGPKQHQQQQGGGGKGMVQMIESGGIDPSVAAGVATMLQNPSLAAFKPNFNFAAFSSDTKRQDAQAQDGYRKEFDFGGGQ